MYEYGFIKISDIQGICFDRVNQKVIFYLPGQQLTFTPKVIEETINDNYNGKFETIGDLIADLDAEGDLFIEIGDRLNKNSPKPFTRKKF